LASVQATRQRTRNHALDLEGRLVIEAEVAVSEAELRWLDLCEAELRTAERNS
jgi:hypothetical protein